MILIGLAVAASLAGASYEGLRDGDIIFHTSRSSQSLALQHATHSPYTHVGLIFRIAGVPNVIEAIGPVRWTPLSRWVARGTGGRAVVRRLREADTRLNASALRRLRSAATRRLGRAYDWSFEWSEDRIYCSELVWKAYQEALGLEVGRLQKLRDFDLRHATVKQKLAERYGKKIPLDETVISPQAVFESDLLETVASFP